MWTRPGWTTALVLGLTAALLSVPHTAQASAGVQRARITLSAPSQAPVNVAFRLSGRARGGGSANDKTIVLQTRSSGAWHSAARLRRQDGGRYRFALTLSQAGTYTFRTLMLRGGNRLDVSPRRSVLLVAPPPTPTPIPTPTPAPVPAPTTAPTSGPPPMQPPTAQVPTTPSELPGVDPGGLACARGDTRITVEAPNRAFTFTDFVDWYIDYVWEWNGSQWVGVGWSQWSSRARWQSGWTRTDGTSGDQLIFNGASGGWYAVTQWFFDGQAGGYWPQMHATYFGQPFCRAG